jgi:23S rRNA 5-hydroxycytidine C2501 synthase
LDHLQKRLELLAPARTADSGIVAINFGADAVYIGAPAFSARAAAGNSVDDIARLSTYAHRFHAKVFVALNTILFDHELDSAQTLIRQLHEAGADALIVQDMGILKMNLPPIELHASTQTNNYSLERIQFLENAGFQRIVLARELTLQQIKEIRTETTVELESFVHGALCVSLSGQCYMSEAQGGRSGNRGVCAQPCRKLYDLVDADGRIIQKQKHLLSLKDLNLSDYLADMALAGITSFKIEGRLKDDSYLKNITAYYRRRLDAFLENNHDYRKASSGKVYFDFVPDPAKTFSRGTSNYFLQGRSADIVSSDTPKSAGEYIGTVDRCHGKILKISSEKSLNNNDGLCFFNSEGKLEGAKVNIAQGNSITLAEEVALQTDTKIYRNYDHAFTELLKNSRTTRKIPVNIQVSAVEEGLRLIISCDEGISYQSVFPVEKTVARQSEKAVETLQVQLSKSGDTVFEVGNVSVDWIEALFLPVSQINQIRRSFLDAYLQFRIEQRNSNTPFIHHTNAELPFKQVSFSENVANRLAEEFYREHGAVDIEPAMEVTKISHGKRLMTMKHCLKYQLGYCPKEKDHNQAPFKEPLFLIDGNRKFRLEFDCLECRMNLFNPKH